MNKKRKFIISSFMKQATYDLEGRVEEIRKSYENKIFESSTTWTEQAERPELVEKDLISEEDVDKYIQKYREFRGYLGELEIKFNSLRSDLASKLKEHPMLTDENGEEIEALRAEMNRILIQGVASNAEGGQPKREVTPPRVRWYEKLIAQKEAGRFDLESIFRPIERLREGLVYQKARSWGLFSRGGSFGYNKYFKRNMKRLYISREEHEAGMDIALDLAKRSLANYPNSSEDFLQLIGFSGIDEAAEYIRYYYIDKITSHKKTTGNSNLQKDEEGQTLTHDVTSILPWYPGHRASIRRVLQIGRKYTSVNVLGFRPLSTEEKRNYWSKEPPTVEGNTFYYNKEADHADESREHILSLAKKYLTYDFSRIYNFTKKEVLAAVKEAIDIAVKEEAEAKIDSYRQVASAYGFGEDFFESLSRAMYSDGIVALLAPSTSTSGHNRIYSEADNRSSLAIYQLINQANRDPWSSSGGDGIDGSEFMAQILEGFTKYVDSINFDTENNVIVDIIKVLRKIDEELAAKIRAGGLHTVFPYGWGNIVGRAGNKPSLHPVMILNNHAWDARLKRLIGKNTTKAVYGHERPDGISAEETEEAIKGAIYYSRIAEEGFSGYRNMRSHMRDPSALHEYNIVSLTGVVKKDEEWQKAEKKVYYDLLDTILEDDTLSEDEKRSAMSEASSKYKEVKKTMSEKEVVKGKETYRKHQEWRRLLPKVILKWYREEEAFMTGRVGWREFVNSVDRSFPRIKNSYAYDAGDEEKGWTDTMWSLNNASIPGFALQVLKDSKQDSISNLLMGIASADEFNSIERMEAFIKEYIYLYFNIGRRATYLLRDLDDSSSENPEFDPDNSFFRRLHSKLSGSKKQKVLKIIKIAELTDNYRSIQGDILSSKYLNKVNLDIFQSALEAYALYKKSIDRILEELDEFYQDNNQIPQGGMGIESQALEALTSKVKGLKEKLRGRVPEGKLDGLIPVDIETIMHEVGQNLYSSTSGEFSNPSESQLDLFIRAFGIRFDELSSDFMIDVKSKVAKFKYVLTLFSQIEIMKEHIDAVESKDENLFKLNMNGEGFRFRVLNDLDPYHFQVGADTNCCQVIGGAGEAAAIDSFVNREAGVLLLEIEEDLQWTLIAQSYFHYVPKENMFILDNIESVGSNVILKAEKKLGRKIPELYLTLGEHAKAQGYNDILVGQEYTVVIDELAFEERRLSQDPRRFKTETTYSDYDIHNGLSLFRPKFELKEKIAFRLGLKGEIRKTSILSRDLALSVIGSYRENGIEDKIIKLQNIMLRMGLEKEGLDLYMFRA